MPLNFSTSGEQIECQVENRIQDNKLKTYYALKYSIKHILVTLGHLSGHTFLIVFIYDPDTTVKTIQTLVINDNVHK